MNSQTENKIYCSVFFFFYFFNSSNSQHQKTTQLNKIKQWHTFICYKSIDIVSNLFSINRFSFFISKDFCHFFLLFNLRLYVICYVWNKHVSLFDADISWNIVSICNELIMLNKITQTIQKITENIAKLKKQIVDNHGLI